MDPPWLMSFENEQVLILTRLAGIEEDAHIMAGYTGSVGLSIVLRRRGIELLPVRIASANHC